MSLLSGFFVVLCIVDLMGRILYGEFYSVMIS